MIFISCHKGCRFVAAVQGTENHRVTGVIIQETNDNLIADLGTEKCTPVFSGVKAGNPGPDPWIIRIDDRQFDQYPVFTVRILLELRYNADL